MSRHCIKLDIVEDVWGKDGQRGRIRGITLRDVAIDGVDVPPVVVAGFDAEHGIEDVRFENVRINGRPLAGPDDVRLQANEHVRGLCVRDS